MLSRGVLRVEGTEFGDRIVVQQANGAYTVSGIAISDGGLARPSAPATAVSRVEIAGLGGDDFIALLDTDTTALAGGIFVSGGTGVDTVAAPAGAVTDGDLADRAMTATEFRAMNDRMQTLVSAAGRLYGLGRDRVVYAYQGPNAAWSAVSGADVRTLAAAGGQLSSAPGSRPRACG